MFCKPLQCLLYWWKYPTGIENQVAVGFADLHQEDETDHMQIWENRQPLLFIGPKSVHCLALSVITMRLSPLQSVNRTIYQNVYLAPHLFAAQFFQMTNIWRKYLNTFTFIAYLTTWIMNNHSHNKIQLYFENNLGTSWMLNQTVGPKYFGWLR